MERINSCSNLGLDMILNTGSVMHKQGKRAANNQFCLGIEHRICILVCVLCYFCKFYYRYRTKDMYTSVCIVLFL